MTAALEGGEWSAARPGRTFVVSTEETTPIGRILEVVRSGVCLVGVRECDGYAV